MAEFTIRKRRKEIGIRKVNGAKISEIMILLNKDFLKWSLLAFVLAVPPVWYIMHSWLGTFAYQTPMNWWIFVLAGLMSTIIGLLTVSWQSLRAATRNPVEALRSE
jgi:putative ABC transport system permease protein